MGLLWPWLIWSAIMVIGQSFQGPAISSVEFLCTLFIHYCFVPLLIPYYLLAPLVVKLARSNTRLLLTGAAVVQLLAVALFYARAYHPRFPAVLKSWVNLGLLQYLRFAFYFSTVKKLGTHSYGLYLCHYPVLGIIVEVVGRAVPWVVSQGWLLLPPLFALTVRSAMLIMEGVARLPVKHFYRYLFG